MDDLKKLSVERLRELARKHLGKGHSRLRTKAELLAALKDALREPLSRLLGAAESVVPRARGKVRVVDFPPGRKGRVRAERATPEADVSSTSPRPPAAAEPAGRATPPRGTPAVKASSAAHATSRGASSSTSQRGPATREPTARTTPPRGTPPAPAVREAVAGATSPRTESSTASSRPPGKRETAPRATPPRGESSPGARAPIRRQARAHATTPAGESSPASHGAPAARRAATRETPPRGEPSPASRVPAAGGAMPRSTPSGGESLPASDRTPAAPEPSTPGPASRAKSSPVSPRPPAARDEASGVTTTRAEPAPASPRAPAPPGATGRGSPPPPEPYPASLGAPGTRDADTRAGRSRPELSAASSRGPSHREPAPLTGGRPPLSASDRGAPLSPASTEPSGSRSTRSAPKTNGAPAAPTARSTGTTTPRPPPAAEAPVEEGFFEVPATPRRPPRTPSPAAPFEPGPFASPREVGTDAPVLLVRDPTTLFAFWDFRRELERGAALGLREPRLLLRLHRGKDLDRTLELPLTSRSTYVTGLSSGQEYTAEVLLLGRDGWTRPVGSRSAPRRLPPGRVSPQMEVRMLRLPWSELLSGAPAPSAPSSPRYEALDSPRRVPLPTSPGARGPAGGSDRSGGSPSGQN